MKNKIAYLFFLIIGSCQAMQDSNNDIIKNFLNTLHIPDIPTIQQFIEKGGDINAPRLGYLIVLQQAVENISFTDTQEDLEIKFKRISYLLSIPSINVHQPNCIGKTAAETVFLNFSPLSPALIKAFCKKIDINELPNKVAPLQYLMTARACNPLEFDWQHPFIQYQVDNYKKALQTFLELKPNFYKDSDGNNPFHHAAINANYFAVQQLCLQPQAEMYIENPNNKNEAPYALLLTAEQKEIETKKDLKHEDTFTIRDIQQCFRPICRDFEKIKNIFENYPKLQQLHLFKQTAIQTRSFNNYISVLPTELIDELKKYVIQSAIE